jgi:cell fate regulator YaaT (PSP1 superfamily)
MVKITGVTFKTGGKVYYFAPGNGVYEKNMGVIVETARGLEYATVTIPLGEVEESKIVPPLKPVVRIANQRDKETVKKNLERKPEAMRLTQEKIEKHNLEMKLIDCEFAFDGSKVIFYYSAPSRVDFRELVKDLSALFRMRIELRQIGIRDEIKMMGGLAPCGRECCCSSCMPDIKKVTIKMAKTQGLSLNPTKISGLCGRLMCCLSYENGYYSEAGKSMPKVGMEVTTPDGKGTVVNINMLKMQVRVRIDDKEKDVFTYHDFPVEQVKFKRPKFEKEEKEEIPEDVKDLLDE